VTTQLRVASKAAPEFVKSVMCNQASGVLKRDSFFKNRLKRNARQPCEVPLSWHTWCYTLGGGERERGVVGREELLFITAAV
jgi:hypothetical protein